MKEKRTAKGGKLAGRTKADILHHVTKSLADWKKIPVEDITRDMCSAKFTELSAKGETQVNCAFRYLRALLNYAREAYRPSGIPILLEKPVSVISGKKMLQPNKAKNGRIPIEKIGPVWNFMKEKNNSDALQDIGKAGANIVIMLMLTGARWSEAAELSSENIN